MTIAVNLDFTTDRRFEDVEGLTFHTDNSAKAYPALTQWTKYQEEGRGSEELVNIDTDRIHVRECYVFEDVLHVSAETVMSPFPTL